MSPPSNEWVPAPVFMIRAPALPVESYLALTQWESRKWPPDDDSPVARLLQDPYVALALAVASDSLAHAMASHVVNARRASRLRRTIIAYLTRMTTRSTPFGLFAAVAMGEWGERTDVTISGKPGLWRARPDMAWLYRLLTRLESDPETLSRVDIRSNPAIFRRGDRVVLLAPGPSGPDSGAPEVSARATPIVLEALELCQAEIPYQTVVRSLCQAGARDPVKVRAAVNALCSQRFLLTDLRPPLTGSPAHHLAERLDFHGAAPQILVKLKRLLHETDVWTRLSHTDALQRWPGLNTEAHGLEAKEPAFQVDAGFGGMPSCLSRAIADEVGRAAKLLLRLSPWPNGRPGLAAWRTRFAETYGFGRDVPVVDLIEHDRGLGLPNLWAGGPHRPHVDRLLMRLATRTLSTDRSPLHLDETRIATLERAFGGPGTRPQSLDLYCAIAAKSRASLDGGDFLLVVSSTAAVSPAGRSFGRFGRLFPEGALALVSGSGEGPEAIHAELLFEPLVPRYGNVMIRPLTATHVIPLDGQAVGRSLVVIPIEELAVRLEDGRLHLRWQREGVEVRAACMHMLNYRLAPPVARFLHTVSHDGESSLAPFYWGPAESLPFRPRVQAGRVVLRLAEWSLDQSYFADFSKDPMSARDRVRLPQFVMLPGGDGFLLADLDSAGGRELVLAEGAKLSPDGTLRVQEALPGPEHAWAQGHDGRRLLELVVPVFRRKDNPTSRKTEPGVSILKTDRFRPPGSDWVYGKFYCSPRLADWLIAEPLLRIAESLRSTGRITSWFFVRYADPAFHLRVRLAGNPGVLQSDVFPEVCTWAAKLMEQGLIERFAFDTYEREVERYGGPQALSVMEQLFAADSQAVAKVLAVRRRLGPALEWPHVIVCTVDDLLDSLGMGLITRLEWYRRYAPTRSHAGAFRVARDRLRALIGRPPNGPGDLLAGPVRTILAERRTVAEMAARELGILQDRHALSAPLFEIARSLVHMHCNRIGADIPKGLAASAPGGGRPPIDPAIGGMRPHDGGLEGRVLALASRTLASLAAWPDTSPGRGRPCQGGS